MYPFDLSHAKGKRLDAGKRPSVESFSIDVIGTLKNLGTNPTIATQTSETYNYFGIILLE